MPLGNDLDAYIDTVNRLEPDIVPIDTTAALASIAISLKRIADQLDGKAPGMNILDVLHGWAGHQR